MAETVRRLSFLLTFITLAGILPQHAISREPLKLQAAENNLQLPGGINESEGRTITADLQTLQDKIDHLRSSLPGVSLEKKADLLADIEIYARSVRWALKYENKLDQNVIGMIRTSLRKGNQRADALMDGKSPWSREHGRLLRGFRSNIDGSTQPYGVIVPTGYDGSKPMRLDVVLHGSVSRWKGSAEIRFEKWFEQNKNWGAALNHNYIEIYPLGRVENGYRWAGETDIFEAIKAVCRNYRIDPDRIVLRGFSMGASGAWHVGLKHPDRFVALGPYSGYVDTRKFSQEFTDPSFVVGTLPPYQEKMLSLLDAVGYAANVGVVPAIAANGSEDGAALRNHLNMAQHMAAEGEQMVNLVALGAGHQLAPATLAKQLELIGLYADRGMNHTPRELRFVTRSLRYNRCNWVELLKLDEHYARSEIKLVAADAGSVKVSTITNVREFAIFPPMLQAQGASLEINGQTIPLPQSVAGATPEARVFLKTNDVWSYAGLRSEVKLTGKSPGLQGPIDDAFSSAFLCVRGTGQPWNPEIGAWADATLRRFAYEWERYMGGALPIKNDTEVTPEDLRTKNLILFGDPGSNSWIAKALPSLPVKWSHDSLQFGETIFSAASNAPALICKSPFEGADHHYVVINSGHTFHEKEFTSPNYLLFPRLGDWAVIRIKSGASSWEPSSSSPFPEDAVRAGIFDEEWKIPVGPKSPAKPKKL